MKFNKIVALALALVMVFALCACGGGNTDTKTDDTGSASKVDTNTVSVGAIVIARDDVPTTPAQQTKWETLHESSCTPPLAQFTLLPL